MGIAPDPSALKPRRKKKSSSSQKNLPSADRAPDPSHPSKKRYHSLVVTASLDDGEADADEQRVLAIQARRRRLADEKARKRLRSLDLKALEELAPDSDEDDQNLKHLVVVDPDPVLVEEFKRQHTRDYRREKLGAGVQLELIKERESQKKSEESSTKPKEEPSVFDEEGDLDLSSLKKVKQGHQGSGDNPATEIVFRDEDGFVITKERWLELQQQKKRGYRPPALREDKKKERQERPAVSWGGGVVQERELKEREEEEKRIAAEPFSRHEIDVEYDKILRDQQWWEDPMRDYIEPTERNNDNELPTQDKPKCRFTAPPNRYNIPAGYRWDGVIRGVNYEAKLLQALNKKKLQKEESYKWSIEDI